MSRTGDGRQSAGRENAIFLRPNACAVQKIVVSAAFRGACEANPAAVGGFAASQPFPHVRRLEKSLVFGAPRPRRNQAEARESHESCVSLLRSTIIDGSSVVVQHVYTKIPTYVYIYISPAAGPDLTV